MCPAAPPPCGATRPCCRRPLRTSSRSAKAGRPLIRTRRLGARLGADALWVKDEGLNPTGSFKARGLACAVSMCVELGIRKVAIPSAGNAASAMAAYAAAAGIEAHIFMPRDVPQANYIECKAFGAHVTLVDGLISDCGRMVAERGPAGGLVRRQHAQGALPHRRQEDHGLRGGRADGLGAARRHLLSHRRRRRHDRHVEGLRRDGGARLDRQPASQDDRRAGRGLPAGGARLRGGRRAQPLLGRRADRGQRPARAQAAGRFPDSGRRARERRHRHRGLATRRCSTPALQLAARRRHLRGARRRGLRGRRSTSCWPPASSSARDRIVIYNTGLRSEVPGSLFHALPARRPRASRTSSAA